MWESTEQGLLSISLTYIGGHSHIPIYKLDKHRCYKNFLGYGKNYTMKKTSIVSFFIGMALEASEVYQIPSERLNNLSVITKLTSVKNGSEDTFPSLCALWV